MYLVDNTGTEHCKLHCSYSKPARAIAKVGCRRSFPQARLSVEETRSNGIKVIRREDGAKGRKRRNGGHSKVEWKRQGSLGVINKCGIERGMRGVGWCGESVGSVEFGIPRSTRLRRRQSERKERKKKRLQGVPR